MTPIQVAIVEDNANIRNGLAIIINGYEGFQCVDTFSTGEEALERIPEIGPDVVLMDIHLPGMSGIECIRHLRERVPDLQIMVLTVYEDDETIFQSLKAGAYGYILKKIPPAELLEAIRTIHNGGSPMSDQIARKVVHAYQTMDVKPGAPESLSDREQTILSYVAKGYHDKEIADALSISFDTVRTHLRNIYKKLQVRSRTEATLKFLHKL